LNPVQGTAARAPFRGGRGNLVAPGLHPCRQPVSITFKRGPCLANQFEPGRFCLGRIVAALLEKLGELPSDVDGSGLITARLIGTNRTIMLQAKHHARGPCKDVDWGYFATIHKYQGSEADGVLVVIPSGTLKLMKAIDDEKEPWFFDRSCLYTACSRPKLSLVLVGDPADIRGAMKLNCSERVTALSRMFAAEETVA
jgi:hypothetical protein